MRRIVIHRPGGFEQLQIESSPDPVVGSGDVLIDVRAIGVNYADVLIRMGLYASAKEMVGWPITPGYEVAGTVAAHGSAVTGFAVGQPVVSLCRWNGYATKVCVPSDFVFEQPNGWSPEEAAGIPAVYMTAYYAIFEVGPPRKTSTVLVHSAAGGVGGALVQLLKHVVGCRVVGVVGASHKVDVVRRHGADEVIDKSRENLWRRAEALAPHGFDRIYDANGVSTLTGSYAHLGMGGRLVIYGFHSMLPHARGRANWLKLVPDYLRTPRFNPFDLVHQSRGVIGFNLSYMFDRTDLLKEGMTLVLDAMNRGEIVPPPVKTFRFDQVADAHRLIQSGQSVGKLVLLVDES